MLVSFQRPAGGSNACGGRRPHDAPQGTCARGSHHPRPPRRIGICLRRRTCMRATPCPRPCPSRTYHTPPQTLHQTRGAFPPLAGSLLSSERQAISERSSTQARISPSPSIAAFLSLINSSHLSFFFHFQMRHMFHVSIYACTNKYLRSSEGAVVAGEVCKTKLQPAGEDVSSSPHLTQNSKSNMTRDHFRSILGIYCHSRFLSSSSSGDEDDGRLTNRPHTASSAPWRQVPAHSSLPARGASGHGVTAHNRQALDYRRVI